MDGKFLRAVGPLLLLVLLAGVLTLLQRDDDSLRWGPKPLSGADQQIIESIVESFYTGN